MKRFNFFVLPYRDMYFVDKYGPAVRDTQIIAALAALENVERVTVVNRPVSVYERAISKSLTKNLNRGKIHYIDKTSLDLIGPLSGRKWFSRCYDQLNKTDFYIDGCTNVILDFLPIGGIDYGSVRHDFVWYDFIDNFAKHNRFDQKEKDLVQKKYARVSRFADVITGVSPGSIQGYDSGIVLPNSPGISPTSRGAVTLDPSAADFGFIGFVTDKFDIDLVRSLTARRHSIIIHGEFYDKAVENSLRSLPGVTTTGMFQHRDIPKLMRTFKVGLIPYRTDRLHDESPLKLYQYLLHGRSVLTSAEYELSGSAVVSYHGKPVSDAADLAVSLLARSVTDDGMSDAVDMIDDSQFWIPKLQSLLERAL
ncbi:hypothetical protein [Devosia sp. MC1541]|uniref:hypothetical protein n=1 Tax=Devosia sp. MC1541 TaxID=2725264 RepID=UPI00145E99D5|nr:hypothetical protein [Devosia sp. MC1541]